MLTHDTLDSRPQARRSTRQCLQVRSLRQAETAAARRIEELESRLREAWPILLMHLNSFCCLCKPQDFGYY